MTLAYIFGSVILISLLSVLAAVPLLVTKKVSKQILLLLVGLSVGTLLGSVFLHFLPEVIEKGFTSSIALIILLGFFSFFLIEKLVHNHHHHKHKHDPLHAHHHAYHLAPMNIFGEIIHNLIDGVVIAASYLISIPLGVAATLSVALHELPQEMADFGILLYAGLSKKKALLFNFLAATSAILGATLTLIVADIAFDVVHEIIPFAMGVFLYIGAANLVPQLHREFAFKDIVLQLLAVGVGILLMFGLTMIGGH